MFKMHSGCIEGQRTENRIPRKLAVEDTRADTIFAERTIVSAFLNSFFAPPIHKRNDSFVATPAAARQTIFNISACRALVLVRTVRVAEKIILNG